MHHSWLLLLILALAGCSSLKTPVQPGAKLEADAQLRFALGQEATRDYTSAKASYATAFASYRTFGELKGQLAALSGLARLELAENAPAQSQSVVTQMEVLISESAPELDYYLLLLRIHKFQLEKDYAAVSRLAVAKTDVPLEETLQLHIAKLQADSFLRKATLSQANEVQKLSQTLHKQLKKRSTGSVELLSAAWYALGYYYFQSRVYAEAGMYADKVVDWDYRYGNFGGMGHGLWLKAQIAVAENKPVEAISLYTRAEGIFNSLGETAMQNSIQQELSALRGEKK